MAQPSICNPEDAEDKEQVDTLSVQLSVTAQVTPTPLWAVVWGPTQPLEDETYHFLSSQETDPHHPHGTQREATVAEDWHYTDTSMQPRAEGPLQSMNLEDQGTGAEETEPEEGGHQGIHMTDFLK